MYSFLILIVLANAIIACIFRMPLYSPFSINAFCWFSSLWLGMFFGADYYPLSDETIFNLCAWILSFSFVTFVSSFNLNPKRKVFRYQIKLGKISFVFMFIFFGLLIELCREIYVVGNIGDYNFFLNLRMAAIEYNKTDYALWFSTTIYPVMLSCFCIFLVGEKRDLSSKLVLSVLFLWHLFYSVATMSKFWFLSLCIIVVATLIYKKTFKIKTALLTFSILALTLYLFNFLRAGIDNSIHTDVIYQILLYFYSPVVALNYVEVTSVHPHFFGEYVFSFFYNLAKTFGLMEGDKISGILPYAYVPVETNIYTALQPFVADFGFFGAIFGALFYGVVYSILYNSINFYGWAFPCYLTIIYSLALQFITETLLMNFSGNIKAIILVLTIYLIFKKFGFVSRLNT